MCILNITMTDKRRLHYEYRHLKLLKPSYLIILALFFLALGVYGLRHNYSEMVRLRTAVAKADKENGDVETALRNLRKYVYSHMNTDLSSGSASIKPPIQLKYRYERLVKQETAKADSANKAVKLQGERICQQQYPSGVYNPDRVNCVAAYLRRHSVKPGTIPEELYKFDFISPVWSPDLAGISLLLCLICLIALIIRLMLGYWYKIQID